MKPRKPYRNKKYSQSHSQTKNTPTHNHEVVIVGHCLMCQGGVSNLTYVLKYGEHYVHIECALKRFRATVEPLMGEKPYKITYLGNNTFGAYVTLRGGMYKWDMQQKMTLEKLVKELLEPQP